jgi:signal transduction histidine kinase
LIFIKAQYFGEGYLCRKKSMKNVIKLEALGLFILFTVTYFQLFPGTWGFYLALFFVPDVSFILFLITKKLGAIAYNIFHHQGILVLMFLIGYYVKDDIVMQIGLIFLAHSTFDRIAGYGLKYFDSFDHTHLGWVGKSKHLNVE